MNPSESLKLMLEQKIQNRTSVMPESARAEAQNVWDQTKAGIPPKFVMGRTGVNALIIAAEELAVLKGGAAPTADATGPRQVATPAIDRLAAASKPAAAPSASSAAPVAAKPATASPAPKAAAPAPTAAKPTHAPAITGNGVFQPTTHAILTRSEFSALSESDKSRFFKEGGKLVDDSDAVPATPSGNEKGGSAMTRAEFNALDHPSRNAFITGGGKLKD